jgi:hypothetical protein
MANIIDRRIIESFFLSGYDPSLTMTAPSDGPPSTIGDLCENDSQLHLMHNGNGSVSISSGSAAGIPAHGIHLLGVPAEPPKVPTNYIRYESNLFQLHNLIFLGCVLKVELQFFLYQSEKLPC